MLLPETLIPTGSASFYKCSGLKTVTIPANAPSIGAFAFAECPKLTTLIINALNPPWTYNSFYNSPLTAIRVPEAGVSAYQKAWESYASIITTQSKSGFIDLVLKRAF